MNLTQSPARTSPPILSIWVFVVWMVLQHRLSLRGSNNSKHLLYWGSLHFILHIPRCRVKIWLGLNWNKDHSITWAELSRCSLHSSCHTELHADYTPLIYATYLLPKASSALGRPYCQNAHTEERLRSSPSKQTRQVKGDARKRQCNEVTCSNWHRQKSPSEFAVSLCLWLPFSYC